MEQKGNEKRRLKKPVRIGLVIMAMVTALFVGGGLASRNTLTAKAAEGVTVVDPDTTNNWSSIATSSTSTENVGRIWTDKSVFDEDYTLEGALDETISMNGSDFLVALSALSSTSNLKTTTTSTKPLDIVLVVDTSGSMDNNNGHDMGYTYTPTYSVRDNGEYYIQVNGQWTEVNHNRNGWYYGNRYNQTYVDYARYEGDTANGRVQFYTQSQSQISRMEALQNAAKSFVDAVAEMNDSITEESQQHRISLVKFASDEDNSIGNDFTSSDYNKSQVVSDLAAYTSQNALSFKNTIDSLYGEGATRADYGLHQAQRVLDGDGSLTGAREDAQKVVIFFTDGNPTTNQDFNNEVAGAAINYAYDMKQAGTIIYSIGVFNGANPSDTYSSFNRYMNAVSSNYPNAQCADYVNVGSYRHPEYEWQQTDDYSDLELGDRAQGAEGAQNPQYYFAATNSDELNQVFDDITTSITSNVGTGSPIEEETNEGAQNTPGYLTFTDKLGDFMQVSGGSMSLVYGNRVEESDSKTTIGNVDTYHFVGTVTANNVYKEANLDDFDVTVTHGSTLKEGDTVTVRIPASLIPLRSYNVDSDNNSLTVTDAYPVRLFYGVSLKEKARSAIDYPQRPGNETNYAEIIGSQTSDNGETIDFYSNSFTENSVNGSTIATFTPSEGNRFYYYTASAPLYTDSTLQTIATESNVAGLETVYYADTYWVQGSTEAQEVTVPVGISTSGQEFASRRRNPYNGQLYIPAHTARNDRPATLTAPKDPVEGGNVTGTATNVLNPTWVNGTVSQTLGNNGKLSFDAPGSLEIKKVVDWGNASEATKQEKNEFTFTISLTDGKNEPLTETYSYYINNAEDASGTVSNNGTITITPDQTVVIKGLPAGTKYTVSEVGANTNGFTTEDNSSGEGAVNNDGKVEGTIVRGTKQNTEFKNTYKAQSVNLSTIATLQVQKNLTGRDWYDTDEFSFIIEGIDGAPVPAETKVSISNADENSGYTKAFGDIEYTEAGKYRYAITEVTDNIDKIAGIDYSAARYRVVVTVSDNMTGSLQVDSVVIEQRLNDDGVEPQEQPSITNNTVVFTNNFDVAVATTNIDGRKSYTDTTGSNPINADKFTFQLAPVGGYATDVGSTSGYTIYAADVPTPNNTEGQTVTTKNTGEGFGFGTISYDGYDVGNTYVYKVTEIQGSEAGMTYDDSKEHLIEVSVEQVIDSDGNTHLTATVLAPYNNPENVTFTNTYDPTDASLEPGNLIHGTKVLQGRDLNQGEEFYFTLTQTDGPATVNPDDGDAYVVVLENPEIQAVNQLNNDRTADFTFSNMTFSQTGDYVFTIDETNAVGGDTEDGDGLTYSKNICTVTVHVSDSTDGSLVVDSVKYNNSVDSNNANAENKAVFTNVYTSEGSYGSEGKLGINVTKQLLDRPMEMGEFGFTIVGDGPDGEVSKLFTNGSTDVEDGVSTMPQLQDMTFDQDDAGKTFIFVIDEEELSGEEALPGVKYDQSQYRVEVTPIDNGDGTMHTVTTVTRIMNSDGNEYSTVVIDQADSSNPDYTVPTFGFINDYDTDPVSVGEDTSNSLQVIKTVTGAPSPEGVDYSFTLTAIGDNISYIEGLDANNQLTVSTNGIINADDLPDTEDDSQTVNFGTLTFTEKGTYSFTVQENEPIFNAGWTFDTSEKTVTVTVVDYDENDVYDGKLHIDSVSGNPVRITNSYMPNEVVIGGDADNKITVQKTVTGADSTAEFEFQIDRVDPTNAMWNNMKVDENFENVISISNVTQAESLTASFGQMTFTEECEYKFTISEVGAADFNAGDNRNGWTYDDHVVNVTVSVTDTDHDGYLEAAVTYDNSGATTEADKRAFVAAFTNKYTTTPAELTQDAESGIGVHKVVNGADTDVDFTFSATFNANAVGNSGTIGNIEGLTGDKLTATISDDFADGDKKFVDFGTVKFTAPGVYVFDVTEDNTADSNSHWTYDGSTHQIKVTVTDDGMGKLVATVEDNDPTFYNTYYNEGDAKDVTSNKGDGSLAGVGDELTYTIDWVNNAVDANGAPVAAEITITDAVPAGTEFVSADNNGVNENGTVTWNLGEQQPGAKGTVSFTVRVTEDAVEAGSVENTATVNIGENNPKQTNTVITDTPKKTATLPATDTDGIQVGDVLTFTIDYLNTADEAGTVTVVDTLPASLTYVDVPEGQTAPDQEGQTLTWTIKNVEPGKGGTITFTAKVNENAVTTSVDNKATVTVGENTYESNTTTNGKVSTGDLEISKTVTAIGATVDANKDFSFTITLTGTDSSALTGTYKYSVNNGAEQDLSFAEGYATITLKHGQTAKITGLPQGADYVVTEAAAGDGYTTTSTGASGTISGTVATAAFTNKYQPGTTPYDPAGTSGVVVTKNVTGNVTTDQLTKAGYTFQFSVENVTPGANSEDGFTMPAITTGTSGPDGTVTFSDISFTAIGDYEITVWEVVPETDDDPNMPGIQSNHITYDQHSYVYTLHVTDDDHDGTLDFAIDPTSVSANENIFTNVFFDEETAKSVTSEDADGNTGDGSMASVGDKLTYTIEWVNNAVDVNGNPQAATVVVTDTIPTNTTVVEDSYGDGVYDADARTITWTFADQPVGATGTVTFTVTVDESAAGTDVQNDATINVGDNQYTTNTVVTTIPGKDVAQAEGDTDGIQVGDILTYTIDYANKTGEATTVTVTDTLPAGLTYVGTTENTPDPSSIDGQIIIWTIPNVGPNTSGEITFQARVNENALTVEDPLNNTATITVGNNTYTTDTTGGEIPSTADLTISKTVENLNGDPVDADKSFSFTIELKDTSGNLLTGDYTANVYNGETQVGPTDFIVSGTDDPATTDRVETAFTLKHGEHIVITGLPVGAQYTITEENPGEGYTVTTDVGLTNVASGTLAADGSSVAYTNSYRSASAALNGAANLTVTKNLEGRDWLTTDEWIFTLNPGDESTKNAIDEQRISMPTNNTLEMNSETPDHQVTFGDITFNKPGKYTFTVTESGYVAGVTNDSDAERTIVVNVKDNGAGQLEATVIGEESETLVFTNTYSTTPITLTGDTAIEVQKTLLNRNWNGDEVYSFVITGSEGAPMPAETTINVGMPAEGNVNTAVFGDMTFDHAGTYVYTITEKAGTDESMVYDNHTATVTVAVSEDQTTGKLSAQVAYNNNDMTEEVVVTEADRANTSVAAFTNTQKMSGAITLNGTKNITGRDFIAGDSFTFDITADGNAPLPEQTSVTITPESGNTAAVNFGTIQFTEEGEYTYHITEEAGSITGMTYDTARRDLIIKVTNDGTGNLIPEVIVGGDQLTWTNNWSLGTVNFESLNGTKTLSGKQLTDYMFTFTVEPLLGAPMGETLLANFNGTATQNLDGSWTAPVELLKNIQFTEPGDYQYLIKEVNDGQPGITYDSTQYKVTLSVAIDGSVTTKIESSLNGTDWAQAESVAFNNTYTVSGTAVLDGTTSLSGTKTLTGRDWKDDDTFSFLLEAADDVTKQAVENNAIVMPDRLVAVQGAYSEDAKVPFHFGNITFTEAGEYSFRISELLPGDGGFVGNTGGITFDDHDRVINVSVHDNGRAELVAEVTNATGDNNWTNKYSVDGAEETVDTVSFGLKKVLVGKTWTNDPFTFTITADDEESNKYMPENTEITVSAPTASDADGNNYAEFGFGTITYDKEGTYKYTITEVAGTNKGITYDTHEAHVTVQVTDDLNGGFAISVSKDAATFTNTYHTELNYEANGAGGLSIQKRLENHDLARGQFSFTVTAADQKSIDKAGFETATYSTHEAKVPTGSTYAENLISVFGNMTFTQEDVDDTYTYTVTETVGDEAGYTYDATQYTVTITSSDDGQGNLTVTTTVSDGTNSTAYTYDNNGAVSGKAVVPFNNAYNAEGTLGGEGNTTIVATKSLTNRPIVDGEFKFNVYNKAAADAAPVTTGTSNAEGVITFGELNYSKAQLLADVNNGLAVKTTVDGKDTFEYQYTVSEDEGNFVNGVTPIASSFDIKVIVTDNNDGTLAIDVTYPGDKEGLEFRNAYGAGEDGSAVLNITGSKELKVESGDNPPDIGGKFTFTISGSEGAPMPAVTEVVNDAAGNVEFGDITYTMANVFGDTGDKEPVEGDITTLSEVREKEFTYTVTETGEVAGVTNDPEASKTFTVTVTDNGDGSISVSSNPTDNKFAFVNTYSVKPLDPSDPTDLGEDGTAPLTISKALSGRTLNDGEFTFVMNGISGTNTEGLTISAVNDASGNVIFADGFVFSAPGTYQFNISETDNALGGVAYDGSNYKANAVVTDNGDGTLSVVWNVTNAAGEEVKNITFNNTYTTTPVEVFVEMSKTLDGRKLAEGEFNFVVKDAESNVVAEVKNNENGVFGFAETYSAAGTYTYTVSEVKGDDKDITYDESVYTITVNVTDDGVGHLYATTAIAEGDQAVDGIVFKNVYTEPEKPVEPSGPATGVWTNPAPFAVTFTASLAAILAILYRRLR